MTRRAAQVKRGRFWLVPGLALCLACTGGGDATPTTPNRVVVGVRSDAGSFNIYTATNAFTQEVSDLLFLKLAEEQDDFAEGPPSFRGALAAAWEFSDDGTRLTLHLDPRARWSDGRPITSADVVFSHRAASSPEVGWVGRDVKDRIAEVSAPDPATVVYRFSAVYPYRLMDAVEGNILPEHVYASIPIARWPKHAFTDAPVVSGPFRLGRYEPGALIELLRNPDYLRAPLPRLDAVIFRILPDVDTLLNELIAGGIDVMPNVPPEAAARIASDGRLRLVRAPDLSYTFVCWNTSRPPFSDPRVRRAMTLAIDRAAIIETLIPATGRPCNGPVPSVLWAYDPDVEKLDHDPAAARRLLAEAGWADHDGDGILDRDGKPLRFELETNQGSDLRAKALEMIVGQLRGAGVDAVPRLYEFGAFIDRHEKHDFDAFLGGWRESTKVDLKSVLHSSAGKSGYNYGLYSDPELDSLIDRAREEADPETSRPLWRRAQQIVARDQPFTFLFEADRLHAVRAGLAGFRPNPRTPFGGLEQWHWEAAP